ncbi:MAG: hypothetical protein RLZZ276_3266 [Pseudomonadota bacterium]|jgi:hypothetical protein
MDGAGTNATGTATGAMAGRHFPATIGGFDAPDERARIDGLVRWVEERYADDLRQRPSKHVYVSALPVEVRAHIDALSDSPAVMDAIAARVPAGSSIIPMKHTDELYISHYNKDRGGDQGLFDRHYDGNLRFLASSMVVRALIYLQSDGAYKVVFADSRVERSFASYEFGLLDFHRELHWVEGTYRVQDRQRILLKCNYLVALPGSGAAARVAMLANTTVFYVVKAAMEYSKSPRTPAQRAVGHLCNLFRRLNIVHPALPAALVAGPAVLAAAAGWLALAP